MYLSVNEAQELYKLGFEKTIYVGETAPFEFYSYHDEEWIVGGRILPQGDLLAPKEVYKNGVLLPSESEMLHWLEYNGFSFDIKCRNGIYKLITSIKGREIKGSGVLCSALYQVIVEILKIYGGNPCKEKPKTYEIIVE